MARANGVWHQQLHEPMSLVETGSTHQRSEDAAWDLGLGIDCGGIDSDHSPDRGSRSWPAKTDARMACPGLKTGCTACKALTRSDESTGFLHRQARIGGS